MVFYLSTRPLRYRREIISPKECLKNNFVGILYSFDCVAFNMQTDGRWLYEIRLDESYTDDEADELREVFIEALAAFGAHLKNAMSAKCLASELTGITYTVNGECIEPCQEGGSA